MVTANVSSDIREKYINEGFDDYIPKPISIKELNRIINTYVKIKDSRGYEVNEMKFSDEKQQEEPNKLMNKIKKITKKATQTNVEMPKSIDVQEISFEEFDTSKAKNDINILMRQQENLL